MALIIYNILIPLKMYLGFYIRDRAGASKAKASRFWALMVSPKVARIFSVPPVHHS
jgi:hypothetical protein